MVSNFSPFGYQTSCKDIRILNVNFFIIRIPTFLILLINFQVFLCLFVLFFTARNYFPNESGREDALLYQNILSIPKFYRLIYQFTTHQSNSLIMYLILVLISIMGIDISFHTNFDQLGRFY